MKTDINNYIQLSLIFINGFFISRLFIKCGIAEKIAFFFIKKSKGYLSRIIIYIVISAALLSMFIPNLISVLAIIPILQIIKKDLASLKSDSKSLDTALALSSLYGANVGGTGSIIGSPANMMLVVFLGTKGVEHADKLNFVSWLGWGLPFVLLFSVFACIMIIFFLIPKKLRNHKINLENVHKHEKYVVHQQISLTISIISFIFWIISSLTNLFFPSFRLINTIIFIFFTIAFITIIFFIKIKDTKLNIKSKILKFKDCYSNLPGKEFVISLSIIIFFITILYLGLDQNLKYIIGKIIPQDANPVIIFILFLLLTIYISEFISNTASAMSFFYIAHTVFTNPANHFNIPVISILMGISVVSIVPSMSPIASPVNAVGYGGLKGVSLKKMISLGFFMNLISVILVTFLCLYFIPWYYNLP